jgi:membrane-bound lytic murein transglycosylase D
MEKPIPMKLLKLGCATLALWLAGCATVPPALDAQPAADGGPGLTLQPTRELNSRGKGSAQAPLFFGSSVAHIPLTPTELHGSGSRLVRPLSPPVDLWDRIRRGYAMPDLESDLVRDREQWYATRPDTIFRMAERSKKYLFHIVEELEMRNMPTELALLPFIESAFNPQAVSGAKAAGMWQFMPATGKYFELKQNAFRDDRRDVLASTRAALDYLQKLYGMFGDWHLALAAYNWGEGSVGRAIAKNQKLGQPTGYLELNMPMETRFYVPKLQAVKNIVSRPDAFNSKLPLIENHPYFQTVTIQRDIDVTLAAKLAEVPLEDFKALNPSINRPVIMAAGTPQVLLPWDNAEVFQSNLESYGGGRLASWTVWVAPTTMRPADAAKRAGMSEAEFRSVNAIPPRMVIRAGSSLLVPRSNTVSQDVAVKVAENGQLSLAPEVVLKRTLVRAGKGDNVASIAQKFKVSADQVAQWNKVGQSANFKAGQQIVVFLAATSQARRSGGGARASVRKSAPPRATAAKSSGTRVIKR